jgi:hypothetical protein
MTWNTFVSIRPGCLLLIFESFVSEVLLVICSRRYITKVHFLIVLEEPLPPSCQDFHSYFGYENRKASRSKNFIFIVLIIYWLYLYILSPKYLFYYQCNVAKHNFYGSTHGINEFGNVLI